MRLGYRMEADSWEPLHAVKLVDNSLLWPQLLGPSIRMLVVRDVRLQGRHCQFLRFMVGVIRRSFMLGVRVKGDLCQLFLHGKIFPNSVIAS